MEHHQTQKRTNLDKKEAKSLVRLLEKSQTDLLKDNPACEAAC